MTGACTIKLFTEVIITETLWAYAFVTASHFWPSLVFAGKARSLTLEWSFVKVATWVEVPMLDLGESGLHQQMLD